MDCLGWNSWVDYCRWIIPNHYTCGCLIGSSKFGFCNPCTTGLYLPLNFEDIIKACTGQSICGFFGWHGNGTDQFFIYGAGLTTPEENNPSSPSKGRSPYYLIAAFAISAVFLWLSLRKVNWTDFLFTVEHAQVELLVVSLLISSISIFSRSMRWRILAGAEKPLPKLSMFWATNIGYMGNNVLPARSGDVLRSFLVARKAELSFWRVLATTVTERIIDALVLILLSLVLIPTVGNLPDWLWGAMRAVGGVGVVALAILFISPFLEKQIHWLISHLPLPLSLQTGVMGLVDQFLLGAKAFIHPGRAFGFFALTAVVWTIDGFGGIILARALHLTLTFPQSLIYLIALGLSSAIPSSPGYVGVYQLVAVTVLPLFGITEAQALALVLTQQILILLVTLTYGLVGLWQLTGSLRFPVVAQGSPNRTP
jgi:glycosyltransferase 2 family protein